MKLEYDKRLSDFAFNFDLRHYITRFESLRSVVVCFIEAGAYTRPLFSST